MNKAKLLDSFIDVAGILTFERKLFLTTVAKIEAVHQYLRLCNIFIYWKTI